MSFGPKALLQRALRTAFKGSVAQKSQTKPLWSKALPESLPDGSGHSAIGRRWEAFTLTLLTDVRPPWPGIFAASTPGFNETPVGVGVEAPGGYYFRFGGRALAWTDSDRELCCDRDSSAVYLADSFPTSRARFIPLGWA
jgi:hypothetical protein